MQRICLIIVRINNIMDYITNKIIFCLNLFWDLCALCNLLWKAGMLQVRSGWQKLQLRSLWMCTLAQNRTFRLRPQLHFDHSRDQLWMLGLHEWRRHHMMFQQMIQCRIHRKLNGINLGGTRVDRCNKYQLQAHLRTN